MASPSSSRRPSDSWSCTEVKAMSHTHVWTVKGFSNCECRYLETSVKPVAHDQNFVFRIRLHPQGNKDSNKDFTFFQVFCIKNDVKYSAKFSVVNDRNEEISTTIYTGQQQLHGYFEYIRRDQLISHLAPADELVLSCSLNIKFDTITKSSYTSKPNNAIDAKDSEVAVDLGELFRHSRMTDFMIVCNEREFPVHKAILAARSPVFAAMLEAHTEESQNGCVQLDDMDPDVLYDMLYFLYSGKSPNLSDMAAELLAASDRFALPGLKEMADSVLRSHLTVENVCRHLVLADMHGSLTLKLEAIKYVAQHSAQVIATDGWHKMIVRHPNIVTEVVSAISNGAPEHASASCSSQRSTSETNYLLTQPPYKRARFGALGGILDKT